MTLKLGEENKMGKGNGNKEKTHIPDFNFAALGWRQPAGGERIEGIGERVGKQHGMEACCIKSRGRGGARGKGIAGK